MYITVIIAIKRWINNWLLPELTVHRGQTYYFKVLNRNLIVTWNVIRIGHYDSSLRSKAATTKSLEVWTIILFTSPVAEMGDMVFYKDLSLWAWYLMIIMIRIDYASWDELIKCYWHCNYHAHMIFFIIINNREEIRVRTAERSDMGWGWGTIQVNKIWWT